MTQISSDRIERIEATLERFAELTFQNAVRYDSTLNRHDDALSRLEANADRHDQALSRLEANVNRHDDALNRMENAIANLTDRLDAFAEQSASERKTFIAEIREIWRYLRYEPGNGTSDSNG